MGVAHLALDLGPGREGGHRVDHHHVERTRADEHVGDLERLLPRVGLADEQLVDVHPDGGGVHRVHRVLGVDVGADAAVALRLGHDVHRHRGLARRLGPEDLDHPAPREAADPEGEIEREGAGGDDLHQHRPLLTHPHDGTLAELLVDLAERHLEGLVPLHCHVLRSIHRVPGVLHSGVLHSGGRGPDLTAPNALTATLRKGCDRVGGGTTRA